MSGDHTGRDTVLAFLAKSLQVTGGQFANDIHDVVGSDQHVVVLATTKVGAPDGDELEDHSALVFHIADGKAAEVWVFEEHQDRWDAFWTKHAT
jgi:ketosteroid isomerase-like protein